MLKGLLKTIGKIYFGHKLVLWMILAVLPVGVSVFMLEMFSNEIVQHIPVGILKQDHSQLADRLERALQSSPVLDVKVNCHDMSECEHAVIRGDLQTFIVLPTDLERRALRLEAPVIPVYSSGQNYLTNMFATKEIRAVITSIGSDLFTASFDDPVKTEIHSVGNIEGNYQGFLALGLLSAMFHLAGMLVAVYIASFPLRDKRVREFYNYAERSWVTLGIASFVPAVIILWLEYMGCYAYTHRMLMPMGFEEFVMVSVAQLLMVICCVGAGMAFVGVIGVMRIATGVSGVIGGPAFAFAGQTYPVMAMPFAVRCFAFVLPLTHVLRVQSMMLLGDVGMAESWNVIKLMGGMALFWTLFGSFAMVLRWQYRLKHDSQIPVAVEDEDVVTIDSLFKGLLEKIRRRK
ncbi:ABC transporter permease [uncultured Fibrobacter sp.]|uniref:ABC transporter permease n=1 Tax=uncultured Fibrobacter sp. TaxID=261512 RepID=UPI0025DA39E2|nr:ABC transporter permease [uncultured Fibrobacter sp.]